MIWEMQQSDVRQADVAALLRQSKPGSGERSRLLREAPIEALGEYLYSSDDRDGVATVLALERIGTAAAIAILAEGVGSGSPLVASYSARALVRLDARSELPAIIACLEDRADELGAAGQQFVINAMRNMPHVSAVPVLANALRDRHYGVRKSAARALIRIRASESTAALQTAADELGFFKGWASRRALGALEASGRP